MSSRRFDFVEVVLCLGLALVLGWLVGHRNPVVLELWQHPDDAALEQYLRERYGPSHHSEHIEEWIVRDYFQDRHGGTFVDVGAWDWQDGSNTVFLEQKLGWSGLAVDALPDVADGWKRHRLRTRFVLAFVDDTNGEPRTLYVADDMAPASSGNAGHTQMFSTPSREVHATSATLDHLLGEAGLTTIDFLSMDIETGEPKALAGFSIDRYRPRLACVEALAPVRADIVGYFARHGYVVVGKYLRIDPRNLWFEPLDVQPNLAQTKSSTNN